jgi:tRNA-uridine 2-sulfurtransferase
MSGGVDSSVTALLMEQRGFRVTGITMKIWDGEIVSGNHSRHSCYGPEEAEDIEDARRVAKQLDIPLEVIDLTREYRNEVLDYFCQEYLAGRTPNPCVKCNQRIKFGALIQKAVASGIDFDFVASGHYARIDYDLESRRYLLKKARDLSKDQSYFLSFLSQEQLSRLIFPLGDYHKTEVREIARRFGLEVAEKPDSQNFISGDYSSVIRAEVNPGQIIDKQGNVLGRHRGIQYYTLGQRKGLEIASKSPLYVTALDLESNTITVGVREEIYSDEFRVAKLNWISLPGLEQPITAAVKIRSSQREAEARINPVDAGSVDVKFKEPQLAIAPSQVAVFYREDVVIGGGIIEKIRN